MPSRFEQLHLRQDPLLASAHVLARSHCAQPTGIRQHGDEQRSLRCVESARGDAEKPLRRRLHAEYTWTKLGDVQIHLEDALLRP